MFRIHWIIALSSLFLLGQTRNLEIAIVDPEPNRIVAGDYDVVLSKNIPGEIARTRLFLDGELVFESEGWVAKIVVEFGDGFESRSLVAEVDTTDGTKYVSKPVVTEAIRVDYVETTRAVLVSAVVKNRKGSPLTKLSKDQFKVFEDGKLLEIQSFNYENLPLDLVMVLDTSSSLRDGIEDLKRAARAFLQQLAPADQVALFEIKNDPRYVQRFTNDPKKLLSHIDAMTSLGQTALFDTLSQALEILPAKRRGRKTIVLFTDGRDSIHEEPSKKAELMRTWIGKAQNRETTLFAIGLGNRINEGALARMAEDTGGRLVFAEKASDLPTAFQEIVLDLKHQYVLGVEPKSSKPGFHSLEVQVKVRGAKVLARRGYTLGSPSPP